jgi:hypothetical protein
MTSVTRDEHGRLVPVVRPKSWRAASVKRSRDRTDRITRARKQKKAWVATTEWASELDRRAIAVLEETGIPWAAIQSWLDALDSREAFAARLLTKQVLETLADSEAAPGERFEARRELYRRLIAAGILD